MLKVPLTPLQKLSRHPVNSSLKTLGLSFNGIGDEGVKHIAAALKANKVLQTLNIEGNEIGDQDSTKGASHGEVPSTKEVCHIRDEVRWQSSRKQKGIEKGSKEGGIQGGSKKQRAKADLQPRQVVNDQPEKGGDRSQDEVLKDLEELSKISSAAKAGLLGADTVVRLDKETPDGLTPEEPGAASEGNNDPPIPGSQVSTRAQALCKSNLTFIIKPTAQYYYKYAPSASPEEQRNKMKAVVIAYTVDDGPDEADAKVAYFAWLPEGQYWSNLGLDLVLDFVVTKQVPPEVVFLIGPGRQLVPEKPGTPAPKAFKVKKRQLLLSVSAKDIDPVATKKYWDDDPGAPTKEFLQKAVDVLVEPHIRFANGAWPASAPLPGIPPYRRNLAPSPERSVAASTPTGAQSAKDTDDRDVQEIASIASRKVPRAATLPKFEIAVMNQPGGKTLGGLNLWLKPKNGAKYGEICLHKGDILDGTGKMPLLRFFFCLH
eukprot:g45646.t1